MTELEIFTSISGDRARKTLCDGSKVEFVPEYEDEECLECGHVSGKRIINEPLFHGKTVRRNGDLFCERCGQEFLGYDKANKIVYEAMAARIPKMIEDANGALLYYRKQR